MTALQSLKESYQSILRLTKDDAWLVDFILSVAVSSRVGKAAEPAWGVLVGPPGSAKTESVRPLAGLDYIKSLDALTSKSLISGFTTDGEDHSLLPQIDQKTVLFSDFTTVIQQDPQQCAEVMGTLRRAFDGEGVSKAFGNQGLKIHKAEFGILACSTSKIDPFLQAQSGLGERFVMMRLRRSKMSRRDYGKLCRHVEEAAKTKHVWRPALRSQVTGLLSRFKERIEVPRPTWSEDYWDRFADAMYLVSGARSLPSRKEGLEDREEPTRIQQQIANLVGARCLLDGRTEWNDEDLYFAMRCGVDTLPPVCASILRMLGTTNKPKSHDQIARYCSISLDWCSRIMKQLQHNDLAAPSGRSGWTLTTDAKEAWESSGILHCLPQPRT